MTRETNSEEMMSHGLPDPRIPDKARLLSMLDRIEEKIRRLERELKALEYSRKTIYSYLTRK